METKIIQILVGPEDPKWQGSLIGLADDGSVYSVGCSGKWELFVDKELTSDPN